MTSVLFHPFPDASPAPLGRGAATLRARAVADAVAEMIAGVVLLGAFIGAMW
jgi:hypothetical protein